MKQSVLIFILALSISTAVAQLIDLPNIEIIAEKNGLPFNTMSSIVQDKQGFIWIGSADGLARYDGYSFITIPRSTAGLTRQSFNAISALAIDNSGKLWIGQLGGMVSRLNPATESIENFTLPGGEGKFISTIFCDSKNVVWCFLGNTGLFRLENNSFKFVTTLDNLPNGNGLIPNSYNVVNNFYEDGNYTFWLSSLNGLYHFSPEKNKLKHISKLSEGQDLPAATYQVLPHGKSGFWCSTYGHGLIYFDRTSQEFKSHKYQKGPVGTNNIIYGIARKNNDEILLSTSGNGLGTFNERTKKFSFYHEGSLDGNGPVCNDIIVDRLGIVWAISDKGLMKWNIGENHFRFNKLRVRKTDNHDYYGVSDVFEDKPTGRKIIGTTYADGLHIFDSVGNETILSFDIHPAGEPYLIVTDFMKCRDGRILMTTRDYLYEITPSNKLIKIPAPNATLDTRQPAFYLRMAQSKKNNDIWIVSSRNGLIHFNAQANKWERLHTENTKGLMDNRILRIAIDKEQRLWLAHNRSGISLFDTKDNTWTTFQHQANDSTSLISNLVSDMIITLAGEVWISTLEGLSQFNSQSNNFINYTLQSGLPSQTIYDIASDDDNNIWAMGNKGLMMIASDKKPVLKFNFEQGMEGVYSSFLVRRGTEGKMYGCTYRGYFTFYPDQILKHTREPIQVLITDVKEGNQSLMVGLQKTTIPINYDRSAVTLEFAALNFLGNQNVYRYRMSGLNNQWVESPNRVVTYSNLPSGSFIFEVALVGGQSYAAALKIEVSTPFWKQLWFRLTIVLLGLGGIYLVYRLRLYQIRHEAKLKSEFNQKLAEVEMKALKAQMNPHFIFNSLNSINRYIVKSEPEKASLYLTKFSKLIRLILENSDNKIISLEQELSAIKLYIELEAFRFNGKFTYSLSLNPNLNPLAVGVPPMIIQPFVENAIWHGLLHKEESGHLDIEIDRSGSGLRCIITDNGIGREKAWELKSKSIDSKKSYGMKITGERLSMLNGESKILGVEIIDLADRDGNPSGTKVIVNIMAVEMEPEY